jgi:hypothetical protein
MQQAIIFYINYYYEESKTYVLLIFALFLSSTLFAQKDIKRLERANSLFEDYSYVQAIEQYEKLLKKNNVPEAQLKLAECYRLTRQMDNAEIQYRKAVENNAIDSIYLYHFASVLKYNKMYEEAKEWYLKFEAFKQDGNGAKQAKFLDLIHYFIRDSSKVEIKNMAFNSENADFSPSFFNDGLLFSSTRTKGKNAGGLDQWTGENYNDLYFIAKVNVDSASKAQLLQGFINSNFHEGPATLDANNNTIYFTRNSIVRGVQKRSKEGVLKIQIYTAKTQDNRWDLIESFSLNNPEYVVCHPSITKDGSRIYFASDMPGGYGGLDIYYSDRARDGWGSPVNLGEFVNSQWNEVFPYIHSTGTLYFASEGLPGLGGLDVYSVRYSGRAWEDVKNLGYPINTSNDDFGFILDSTNKSGYISSNRKGGKGNDDIYSVFIKDSYFEEGVLLTEDEEVLNNNIIETNDFDTLEEDDSVQIKAAVNTIAGLDVVENNDAIEEALTLKLFKPDYAQEDELAKKLLKSDAQIKADKLVAEKEIKRKNEEDNSVEVLPTQSSSNSTVNTTEKNNATSNSTKTSTPVFSKQLSEMKDEKGRLVLEKAAAGAKVKKVEGLTYRVQVGAYSKPLKKSPDDYFKFEGIETYSINDAITRYVTPLKFTDIKSAEAHKKQMNAKGVKDSWIVSFYNGKRISVQETLELLQQK